MLDETKVYDQYDPGNIHSLLYNFYEQFTLGREIAEASDYMLIDSSEVEEIIIAGMGGSAIGADLLKCYGMYELKEPMFVNRDYLLPGFANENSLVILSSYSGNTEETISVLEAAKFLGTKLFAITSDGQVSNYAQDFGFGVVEIPGGLPPRSALGYSFVPLTVLFSLWGFIPDETENLKTTMYALHKGAEKLSREIPENLNIAKQLARKLYGKLPLVYSSPRLEAVATRFRGQINENAKTLAYSAVVPEMNHNELVGWKTLGSYKDSLAPIFLIDPDDHPRNKFRMEFVGNVMREMGIEPIVLEPPQTDAPFMTRMFELVQLGDFTSYYLAILNRENPKPVDVIDRLKASLAEFEK